MSRILNAASVAAVLSTATAMLLLTEPGRANDLVVSSVSPSVVALDVTGNASIKPVMIEPVVPVSETTDQESADKDIESRPSTLAEMVKATPHPEVITDELHCLAAAVYFESRSESLAGQLAVAHVVINRAESGRFARSLCGVVYQKSQFSFVRGGRMPAIKTGGQQWRNAVAIAQIAQADAWKNHAPGALFFHATHVSPGWNRPRVAQIDNHIFYR